MTKKILPVVVFFSLSALHAQETPPPENWKPAGEVGGADTMSGKENQPASELQPAPAPEKWQPAGEITPPAPTAGAGQAGLIPRPMVKYGDFELSVFGRLQPLVGVVGDDAHTSNGDTLSRDGFRLRRARLGVEGQLIKNWTYQLQLDLADEYNGGSVLLDAVIGWHPVAYAWLDFGAQKVPFGRQQMTSFSELQFIERAPWEAVERAAGAAILDPGRQMGISLGGRVWLLNWWAGVYNGARGFSLGDIHDGLLYVLRLEAGSEDLGPAEADLEGGGFRWSVGLGGYLNQAESFEVRAASADAAMKWRGLSLRAEGLWAKAIPDARPEGTGTIPGESERWCLYAQAGYVLPLNLEPVKLELAARFSLLDDNVHLDDEGDLWEVVGGINLYLRGNDLKFMLDYIVKEERHGRSLSNDAVLAMLQLRF
jgi:hypothetical protein